MHECEGLREMNDNTLMFICIMAAMFLGAFLLALAILVSSGVIVPHGCVWHIVSWDTGANGDKLPHYGC